jgi:putative ABC transport system permease protein
MGAAAMTVPFTLLNLAHQKRRTFIAILGVAFADLLVFVQLGFLGSAESSAVILFDKLDYDLMLLSPDYIDVYRPGSFARARLYQMLADPDVHDVAPLYVTSSFWRIVQPNDPQRQGRRRNMMIVGFNLADHPFRLPGLRAEAEALKEPGAVLIDNHSRNYFGDLSRGVETELGVAHVRVVGRFTIGTGFGADGMVLLSDDTFAHVLGGLSLDKINLGLVRLRPGANADVVARRIRASLPGGRLEPLRVYSRRAVETREIQFWVHQTSLGFIFTAGVAVAFLVGVVFVYQVVSSDIKNRMREFATLKALGYSDHYLDRTVLAQSLAYALLAFPLALVAALLLYAWVERTSLLPMAMPLERVLIVLTLALTMCALSGLLALRRVKTLDPADLF